MARKWLYFPFRDISQDATMPSNRTRYEAKYGTDLRVARQGDSLQDVADDEMLIIGGHGLPDSGRIGVAIDKGLTIFGVQVQRPTQITTTANDLAQELADAGLPLTHKYLKLITCGGAGMAAVDDAKATISADRTRVTAISVVRHDHAAECLAGALGAALGVRKYAQILVKGYPGFVNGQGPQKMVAVEGTSEFSQTKTLFGALTGAAARGSQYWKDGKVGMVSVPSKLLNDYWFNARGELVRQRISLKATT